VGAIEHWKLAGSYYETCNCQAVCPCRRLNGNPGRRSTFQRCQFLLSWKIESGFADEVDLKGQLVAMAGFYDNAVPKAPWTIVLYIDERAHTAAFDALSSIFLGKSGGTVPFTANIADVLAVRRAELRLDHSEDHQRIWIRDFASATVEKRADVEGTVTCGIPGHEHPGVESVARSSVNDGQLNWAYEGRCGFATDFDYRS
jgi:hypothetical protein